MSGIFCSRQELVSVVLDGVVCCVESMAARQGGAARVGAGFSLWRPLDGAGTGGGCDRGAEAALGCSPVAASPAHRHSRQPFLRGARAGSPHQGDLKVRTVMRCGDAEGGWRTVDGGMGEPVTCLLAQTHALEGCLRRKSLSFVDCKFFSTSKQLLAGNLM